MFPIAQILGFLIAVLACAIAPGSDNLSALGISLSKGRIAGMGFGIGCGLGCLTHTLWATLGVSVVLTTSAIAFAVFKFAGAAYLIYLGVRAIRSSSLHLDKDISDQSNGQPQRGFMPFMLRGFVANAINPKVALFFLAFLPQFVNYQKGISLQIAVLGILFSLITIGVFLVLSHFSSAAGNWLRAKRNVGKWLDRIVGGLFVGLGIRLFFMRKPV